MAWMSERETARYGKRVIVEWREAGRHRSKPFPASKQGRADARFFKASLERAERLGQMSSELLGSEQPLRDFILAEWWVKYAKARLKPGTLASYELVLDKWIVAYLGDLRLRDVTRETVDQWVAEMRKAGAGAPTINRCLAILQGIMRRAVEWHRIPVNPVASVPRLPHVRAEGIRARTPEEVETIRVRLGLADAVLVSVLAYEGLRPAEAWLLRWPDVIDGGRPRKRIRIARSLSGEEVSSPKSKRERTVELFAPVGKDLLELYVQRGRPPLTDLVFPTSSGGVQRRQNWRQRVWQKALAGDPKKGVAAIGYFRPYDLRHTCASLLIAEGRSMLELAAHMGHADPGFTLRVYGHLFDDARHRRQIPIGDAITAARRKVRAKTA